MTPLRGSAGAVVALVVMLAAVAFDLGRDGVGGVTKLNTSCSLTRIRQ